MSDGEREIEIDIGDEHVAGTLVRPRGHVPGVLFVHGWGGDREQYLARARAVAKLGCVSLTIDLRGHGRAAGDRETITREDNLADVLAAFDMLAAARGVDRDALAIVGSSYGAYLGAIATTLRPVRWLGLRAPALYDDRNWQTPKHELDKNALHSYRRHVHKPDANRALAACAAFEGDVLVVQSEHDDAVPHPTIESYVRACSRARSLTCRVLEGADHGMSTPEAQHAYTSVLVGWLREMVFGSR
jgi:dipeptidyl aminopeptidase/acylaminoacyl peptidase